MGKFWQFIQLAVLYLALFWLFVVTGNVLAQRVDDNRFLRVEGKQETQDFQITTNTAHIEEMQRRLLEIDSKKYDERIARLEETASLNKDLLVGIALGLSLLLVEAMFRIVGASNKTISKVIPKAS